MSFAQPYWLLGGLLFCIILSIWLHMQQKRKWASLTQFASPHLIGQLTRNISKEKRRYKHFLLLMAILCCFIALARPQYGHKWVEVKRKGIDLLFALDTSKSMLAEDIKPNRLKRAHFAILDFIQQLEGDRVGLLPFAGSAYLMCPLTIDYDAFEQSLAAVNTEIIPKGGTNISEVIEKATSVLENSGNHKILIILTDGENLQGDALKGAETAAAKELTIYTVGVGSSQGELIPLAGGKKGFIKDSQGNFVTSKLDETTLSAIAEKSGGMYAPLGNSGEGLETIYQQKLALIPKEELMEKRHKVPLERFEWPLGAALVLLLLEFGVGERKNGRSGGLLNRLGKKIRVSATASIILIGLVAFTSESANATNGQESFDTGDYLKAAEYYSRLLEKYPGDAKLHYNYGSCAFKNNLYDDAVNSFTKALKSEDIGLQQKAYFNKGNSHYQKGAEMLQADPQGTADEWTQALESLSSAMVLNPEDSNAAHNHDVIKKRLEELQKQLENQPQEKNSDKQPQPDQKTNTENQQKSDQQQDDEQQNSDQQQKSESEKSRDNSSTDKSEGEQRAENDIQQDGNKEKDNEEELKAPTTIDQSAENKEENKQQAQAAQDAERREEGKMTKEEAEQLLNGLKNEEGELNFIPRRSKDSEVEKDW